MPLKLTELEHKWAAVDVFGDGTVMAKYLPSRFNDDVINVGKATQRMAVRMEAKQKELDALPEPPVGADKTIMEVAELRREELEREIEAMQTEITKRNIDFLDNLLYDADLLDDDGNPYKPTREDWAKLGYIIQGYYVQAIFEDIEGKAKKANG